MIIDCVRERRPPFSPRRSVAEFFRGAALVRPARRATGDRYAGEWPREQFRKHGIEYALAPLPKSQLYAAFLPRINSGSVELLDHPRLIAQLVGLERRTTRGSRDSIDHGPGAHDDLINAVALAAVTAGDESRAVAEIRATVGLW